MRKVGWYNDSVTENAKVEISMEGDAFVNPAEEIKDWANYLANPWSDTSHGYNICRVQESDNGEYVCEYHVVVYDFVDAGLFGYGKTANEALKNAQDFAVYIVATHAAKNT